MFHPAILRGVVNWINLFVDPEEDDDPEEMEKLKKHYEELLNKKEIQVTNLESQLKSHHANSKGKSPTHSSSNNKNASDQEMMNLIEEHIVDLEKIDKMNKEIAGLMGIADAAKKEAREWENKFTISHNDLTKDLHNRIVKHQSDLKLRDEEVQHYAEVNDKYLSEITKLQDWIKNYTNATSSPPINTNELLLTQNALQELEQKYKRLEQLYKEKEDSFSAINKLVDQYHKNQKELSQENQKFKVSIESLSQETTNLNTKIKEFNDTITKQQKEIRSLSDENSRLKSVTTTKSSSHASSDDKDTIIARKDDLISSQREGMIKERNRANTAEATIVLLKEQLAVFEANSKTHVAGIGAHDLRINPTDVSVDYPNIRARIKNIFEEIKGIIKTNYDESLTPILRGIVRPTEYDKIKGMRKEPTPKYKQCLLFLSCLMQIVMKDFDRYEFGITGDSVEVERNEERNEYGRASIEVGKTNYTDMNLRAQSIGPRWVALYFQWLEFRIGEIKYVFQSHRHLIDPILQMDEFQLLMHRIFKFHLMVFSFYPRPDLIIRRSGSQQIKMTAPFVEETGFSTDDYIRNLQPQGISFMVFPGLTFEKTSYEALVVYF